MKNLLLYQVDAFTDHLFGGNPAAVIPLDAFLKDELMQEIAAENNLSETAFVVAAEAGAFHIRWFTPASEVRLCGHATLAAAHTLFSTTAKAQSSITFHTREVGDLIVSRKSDKAYTLDFPADFPQEVEVSGHLTEIIKQKPKAVLSGMDDLLVIIDNETQLKSLQPDLALLARVEKRGMIVSAPGDEVDFVSRCFYPRFGVDEDPVTGSAHTLLTPYWAGRLNKNELKAVQLSKRQGLLDCELKGDRVFLTGSAVTYMKGELYLENC